MPFQIEAIDEFDKDIKRLRKKYPSLKSDFANLLKSLVENPVLGTPLGSDCFKIRVNIKSKGKGKRGGARVISCVKIVKEKIYLLAIYDKSEHEDISDDELSHLIKQIPAE